jgi:hypothetical protein
VVKIRKQGQFTKKFLNVDKSSGFQKKASTNPKALTIKELMYNTDYPKVIPMLRR